MINLNKTQRNEELDRFWLEIVSFFNESYLTNSFKSVIVLLFYMGTEKSLISFFMSCTSHKLARLCVYITNRMEIQSAYYYSRRSAIVLQNTKALLLKTLAAYSKTKKCHLISSCLYVHREKMTSDFR